MFSSNSREDSTSHNEIIEISAERYSKLLELETKLPNLIEDALHQHKMNTLKKLHEEDKLHPERVNERARRYVAKHREQINAKRRERRLLYRASHPVEIRKDSVADTLKSSYLCSASESGITLSFSS